MCGQPLHVARIGRGEDAGQLWRPPCRFSSPVRGRALIRGIGPAERAGHQPEGGLRRPLEVVRTLFAPKGFLRDNEARTRHYLRAHDDRAFGPRPALRRGPEPL